MTEFGKTETESSAASKLSVSNQRLGVIRGIALSCPWRLGVSVLTVTASEDHRSRRAARPLSRPRLEALAKLSGFDSTYLTVFDWERRQQDVRFVYSTGSIQVSEGLKLPVPAGFSSEALSGVSRSPVDLERTYPDSAVARSLGLTAYVSVPVVVSEHRIFGMVCGASKASRRAGESLISVMEFFAQII